MITSTSTTFLQNASCTLQCTSLGVVYADISMQDKVMVFDNEKLLIGWGPADCNRVPRTRDVSIWS